MSDQQLNGFTPSPKSDEKSGKTIFDAIPSKTSFFVGLVAGVMAFATVGFIVIVASGADWSKLGFAKGSGAFKPSVANTNANTNAPAPEGNDLSKLPPITAADHVRGDLSKAKVVMIEYSDYECPFCKNGTATISKVFKSYGTDVAWIYRHFPLSFHQNAQKEAEASECVASLGGNDAFWKFTDKIYERTTSNGLGFALTALGPLAKEVGVDQAKFQDCLNSGKFAQTVSDQEAGGAAAGVDGTPATIIISKDGKSDVITGAQPESKFKAVIDGMLNK